MLSAIAASTGGPGTSTTPSVRGRERDAVRNGECRDGEGDAPPAADQDHQRENEQQVIEPEQDVLGPETEVGDGHFRRARRALYDERRPRRRQPFRLRRTAEAFDAHENVRRGRRQAVDGDGLSGEPAAAPDRPALGVGVADEPRLRRRHVARAPGQLEVDREPQVAAACRDLEQQTVGVGRRLADFQIAGAEFVRRRGTREQRTEDAEEHGEASHRAAADAATLAGFSTTIR